MQAVWYRASGMVQGKRYGTGQAVWYRANGMVQGNHPQKLTLEVAEFGQFAKNLPHENFLLYSVYMTGSCKVHF